MLIIFKAIELANANYLMKGWVFTMVPLALAGIGEENTIKKIGGSPQSKKYLEALGFVVGGSATVVTSLSGNVIVNVKDARVAISEEMARKIMV